ncbi:hypothetical protein ACOME3_003922 [Neoechinorhynchus agilis]
MFGRIFLITAFYFHQIQCDFAFEQLKNAEILNNCKSRSTINCQEIGTYIISSTKKLNNCTISCNSSVKFQLFFVDKSRISVPTFRIDDFQDTIDYRVSRFLIKETWETVSHSVEDFPIIHIEVNSCGVRRKEECSSNKPTIAIWNNERKRLRVSMVHLSEAVSVKMTNSKGESVFFDKPINNSRLVIDDDLNESVFIQVCLKNGKDLESKKGRSHVKILCDIS